MAQWYFFKSLIKTASNCHSCGHSVLFVFVAVFPFTPCPALLLPSLFVDVCFCVVGVVFLKMQKLTFQASELYI